VASAAGMLTGDTVAGRFLPVRWRRRLITPVQVLLAAPYLLFLFGPPLPLAVALAAVASAGYAGSLLLQDRLVALTPDDLRGQSLGLHSSGMLTMQAVGASVASGVAQFLSPGHAMVVMATASLLVSLSLATRLAPRFAGRSAATRSCR